MPSTVPGILLMLSQLVLWYEAPLKSWAQCRIFNIKVSCKIGREGKREGGRTLPTQTLKYVHQSGDTGITIL